jgi:hypothetical protein
MIVFETLRGLASLLIMSILKDCQSPSTKSSIGLEVNIESIPRPYSEYFRPISTLTFPEPPKMAIPKKAPLADQFAALSKKWNNSLQKQNLVTLIRKNLLASETLYIDNTMCLGLGCMNDIEFLGSAYMRTNLTALPNSEVTSHTAKSKRVLKIALSNHSLFQLILFETALAILGEKFKLPQVCFQDPAFSQVDVDFLEGRGHEVLPYSKPGNGGGWMCDLQMLKRIANSTFLYAPYLNYDPLAEVIGIGRPGLILSCDPLHLLGPGCPYVVNFPPSHAFLQI